MLSLPALKGRGFPRKIDELLNLWAEQLYTGEALSEPVALALLEDGRCEDSAFLDELREFAGVIA